MYLDHRDILGNTHNHSFICAYEGIAEEFHRARDNQVWHKLGNKFLDKRFVNKLFDGGKKLRADFYLFISNLHKIDLGKIHTHKLIGLFIKSCYFHSRFRGFFKTSRGEFLGLAEKELKQFLLNKTRDEGEGLKIFELLTTPSKFDEINKELADWVTLLSPKRACGKEEILRHVYKYPWLAAHSYDLNEIKNMFYNRYQADRQQFRSLQDDLDELIKSKTALANQQKRILIQYNNKFINYLSWLFQEAALERMRLKGGWAGSDFLYRQLYSEIARRADIPLEDLYSLYKIDEAIKALKLKQPALDQREKEQRKRIYMFWLKSGHLHFFSGSKAEALIQKELKNIINKQKGVKILKGQPASLGQAIGPVRIIIPGDLKMLSHAFMNVKPGEIMVTTMTQPNMVPMMKKVAAIVTDEGGLTSHAAIIARELGIPCVVGTQMGTRVFKDGDMIEVDAERGIVRKL